MILFLPLFALEPILHRVEAEARSNGGIEEAIREVCGRSAHRFFNM